MKFDEEYGKYYLWNVASSKIHGQGIHAANYLRPNQIIGLAIQNSFGFLPVVTPFGKKVNHSYTPNAILRYDKETGTYNLIAKRQIFPGEEITADYNDTPFFIKKPEPHYR
jgi:hypothetical protein